MVRKIKDIDISQKTFRYQAKIVRDKYLAVLIFEFQASILKMRDSMSGDCVATLFFKPFEVVLSYI